jgi:hypothetical protein
MIDNLTLYYEWIQSQQLGYSVETLIAIILGISTLVTIIWVVRRILSLFIKSGFTNRFIAFALVVLVGPITLYYQLNYEIQPLMYAILLAYSAIWLSKEAYHMFYLHNTD